MIINGSISVRSLTTINHDGKVVAFGTAEGGKIYYAVKRSGFEDSAIKPGVEPFGFEDWQPVLYTYLGWAVVLCAGQVLVRLDARTARALVRSGELPSRKLGRRLYVRRSDLLALVPPRRAGMAPGDAAASVRRKTARPLLIAAVTARYRAQYDALATLIEATPPRVAFARAG